MRLRGAIGACVLAMAAACEQSGVRWAEPQAAQGDTLGVITLAPDGSVGFARVDSLRSMPVDPSRCHNSLAVATDGSSMFAAWLRVRPDSTVAVVSSRSINGAAWERTEVVDSVDTAQYGCNRPGPSIAAADGYVHVAYSMKAPEGFGVFVSHTMDGMPMFHSPVIVVYGDRLSQTAVAARGMRVVVAYENPSGNNSRVDIALSSTQGHTFDQREAGSPDQMVAKAPRVAIRDSLVAISFVGGDGATRAVRIGTIY